MFDLLHRDARRVVDGSWDDVKPYYAELTRRPLSGGTVHGFLKDWTLLAEVMDEAFSRLHVATTVNTADKEAERRYHAFLDAVYPRVEEAEQGLIRKLLESGLTPDGFGQPLLKMRTEAEIFREENLELQVKEHKLSTEYDRIIGAQTVDWDGRELTVSQLRPLFQKTDRAEREAAWRSSLTRQLQDRQPINDLWSRFMDLRLQMAANAGFGDYRSFRWKEMLRFDYSPDDCLRFHRAIEAAVVPAAERVSERRRRLLGVETLRPWDLDVDPMGRPALKPFSDVSELGTLAARVFHRLDSGLGGYFDTMLREGLLDLENRKSKAPGGYCTEFAVAKRPFIFMNAVGVHDDVQTILHESGHAFHVFERSDLPYYRQREVGMEFAEVASMSMELLALPYLAESEGGFYSVEDASRAVIEHLERNILFWPYMAAVDAFQHWVYENPSEACRPEVCDAQWATQWNRFMGWMDWSGLDEELKTGWHRKLHIHQLPFYYVEYGLALLGSVQVWNRSLTDRSEALASYRKALSLGGTVSIPELFRAAGAQFTFDEESLGSAVALMERTVESLLDGSA